MAFSNSNLALTGSLQQLWGPGFCQSLGMGFVGGRGLSRVTLNVFHDQHGPSGSEF